MIDRVTSIVADRLAEGRTRIEHQDRVVTGMSSKHFKHRTLVIGAEVEVAIPCHNAIEGSSMPKTAHVRNNPLLVREPLSTQRDQRRRAIYPRHTNSMGHNITCDRHTPATSEVEDTCTFGQQSNEAVMPFLVVPTAASPIGIPFRKRDARSGRLSHRRGQPLSRAG